MKAMKRFLDNFNFGKQEGRHMNIELPALAFPDKHFDLIFI